MNPVSDWSDPHQTGLALVKNALLEDRALEDAATEALGELRKTRVTCTVNSREPVTVAGLPFASLVYEVLPGDASVVPLVSEGSSVAGDTALALIKGTASEVLRGERVFLNILGRLCGIATLTSRFVSECSGTAAEILDTRKTTPCMRALEKYAVRMGGGTNHRFSLADMAMLKDNHLAAAGGADRLGPLMKKLRLMKVPVEIEVDNLIQLEQILPLKPERILLDNMSLEELVKAVKMAERSGIYLEASGRVSLGTVRSIALTGVNGISAGSLTHSAGCSDISFDWQFNGSAQ